MTVDGRAERVSRTWWTCQRCSNQNFATEPRCQCGFSLVKSEQLMIVNAIRAKPGLTKADLLDEFPHLSKPKLNRRLEALFALEQIVAMPNLAVDGRIKQYFIKERLPGSPVPGGQ
ncbi:MAG: zinc finger Ran-binding domain-containing protein [Candidatus Odinarchaeota archaeon]